MPRRTPGAAALHSAAPVAEPLYALRLDANTLRLAMSCEEAAELTGVPVRRIYDAIHDEELIPAPISGRRPRITVQALLTYLGLLPDTEQRKTA